MPEVFEHSVLDLGGGMVDGLPATHIEDREMALIENFYPYGSKLVRRKGSSSIAGRTSDRISAIVTLRTSAGVWRAVLGCATLLRYVDGSGLVDIPRSEGGTHTSSNLPWRIKQYADYLLAARRGVGLRRLPDDLSYDQAAGIAAPTSAPTLAQGAAGALSAANYYGVVTFRNSNTGAESNPSSASAVLALAANRKIDWSAIPVSTNSQVNQRRLWRTLGDQTGEYYLVATINDNVTTTYTGDNVTTDDLGEAVSFDNGVPPANIEIIETHLERLFGTDGIDVFFSNIGQMEGFAADAIAQFEPEDGHKIRALKSWGRDRLVVGKTNKIHLLRGTGPANFEPDVLSDRQGIWSNESVHVIGGSLFFYGGDDVYRSDGGPPVPIGSPNVKAVLDAIPDSERENVVGTVFPKYNLYLLCVRQPPNNGTTDLVLAHNYRTGAWSTLHYFSGGVADGFEGPLGTRAPHAIAQVFDSSYGEQLYGAFNNGFLYNIWTGTRDRNIAFNSKVRTKSFALGSQGLWKTLRQLFLLCTSAAANITVKALLDGSTTATKSRTVSLDTDREWKRFSLSTLGKPAATIQIEIEYNGDPQIEIAGLSLHGTRWKRGGQAA